MLSNKTMPFLYGISLIFFKIADSIFPKQLYDVVAQKQGLAAMSWPKNQGYIWKMLPRDLNGL